MARPPRDRGADWMRLKEPYLILSPNFNDNPVP